jgi:cysteinyl-tRNA synthetase
VTEEALSRPTPDVTVLALVQARAVARAAREWSTADSIRRQLEELGWQVNDTPAGATLDWLGRQ